MCKGGCTYIRGFGMSVHIKDTLEPGAVQVELWQSWSLPVWHACIIIASSMMQNIYAWVDNVNSRILPFW